MKTPLLIHNHITSNVGFSVTISRFCKKAGKLISIIGPIEVVESHNLLHNTNWLISLMIQSKLTWKNLRHCSLIRSFTRIKLMYSVVLCGGFSCGCAKYDAIRVAFFFAVFSSLLEILKLSWVRSFRFSYWRHTILCLSICLLVCPRVCLFDCLCIVLFVCLWLCASFCHFR